MEIAIKQEIETYIVEKLLAGKIDKCLYRLQIFMHKLLMKRLLALRINAYIKTVMWPQINLRILMRIHKTGQGWVIKLY